MVSLTELFPRNGAGFISSRDGLVVGADRKRLEQSIVAFGNDTDSESAIYERYGFGPSKRLVLRAAQRAVRQDVNVARAIMPCLYRPFDQRWVYYTRELIESFKPIAFNFAIKGNVALLATRQVTRTAYEHAFVSRCMAEIKVCSHDRNTQVFPLFVDSSEDELAFSTGTTPNLAAPVLHNLANALRLKLHLDTREIGKEDELSPLRLFHFIYAVLHCPGYRERYFEFLKSDFPRIPLTGNLELFGSLTRLGGELVALHLLESPKVAQPITEGIGGRNPEVEKVSWSTNTVWLDKDQTIGFKGVPEAVWNFHIGGYHVCEKWLKDRRGRTLSKHDIAHYQKIVVALSETILLMKRIDEVIDEHGGWPGAFQGGALAALPTAESPAAVSATEEPQSRKKTSAAQDAGLFEANDHQAAERVAAAQEAGSARQWDDDEWMCMIRQVSGAGGSRDREAAIQEYARALGHQRTGSRVREDVENAIRTAVRRGVLVTENGEVRLRVRSIEEYDRDFVKGQFLASLQGKAWAERDDATRGFARWLGFRRTGPAIENIAKSIINGLLREDRLEANGSKIRRAN